MEKTTVSPYPFLEQLPHGVLVLDKDLNVVAVNNRALELFAIPVESLLTEPLTELLGQSTLGTMLQDGPVGAINLQKVNFLRKGKHLQATISLPDLEKDDPGHMVITVEDISHFKQMETIKMEFISNLLHKIRNPLTSIKTSLSMLMKGMVANLPEDAREILELSHREVNRLNMLLNDLRNVFAVETGMIKRELEPETIEIIKVLDRSREEVSSSFPDPEAVKERFSIDGDLSTRFSGDFDKTKQALGNILRNAVIYSDPNTKIRVTVRKEKDQVTLLIQDKGIGIPEKAMDHIFEKYYRADNVFPAEIEGNGLGLYIAHAFIEAMNGNLYCESREKQGSTFLVTFPC